MNEISELKKERSNPVKKTTKDDKIKESKIKTKKHDFENTLKSLKQNIDFYRKRQKSLNKKKIILFIAEVLIGSG